MAITQTYTDSSTRELTAKPRSRLGGPGAPRPAAREDWFERFTANSPFGSHMPLDTEMHWDWRNPLNLIPAAVLLLIVIALVAVIV